MTTATSNETIFGAPTSNGYMSYVAIAIKTTRIIFKCQECSHVWARDYRKCYREITKSFYGYQDTRPSKNCRYVDDLVRVENGKEYILRLEAHSCPACDGVRVTENAVKGIQTDKKCDSRCTHAKGHNCECACGGANHGSGRLM